MGAGGDTTPPADSSAHADNRPRPSIRVGLAAGFAHPQKHDQYWSELMTSPLLRVESA